MAFRFRLLALLLILAPRTLAQHGQDTEGAGDAYLPEVAEASDEAERSGASFQVPEGFQLKLWAAEPHLANPVAFCLDAAGRCFVAETFRLHRGVTDMRSHMDWLHDELAAQTVEDRVAFMRKHEGESFEDYSQEHERVRLLADTNGDGRADLSTVYADGFRSPASGIAAGLLARGTDLYYTCIPDLWKLSDRDGNGVAESRQSLHTGFGVKIALLGHDLHGLRLGPDGRLYFSIGDRGLHVEHEGGTFALPDRGAVLRCELDGSNLELFATGLRNPQELVFDDHGNLFTGDNNSDGGDRARWVYVVRGGDSGWRHNYQYVTRPNLRGPWNAEKGWHPHHPEQAAHITPPVANFADGPSGLTYYPGGLWEGDWDGTFFLCDFRGAARGSGVYALRTEAKGAGFSLIDDRRFLWDSLVTDVDFGTDGAMWVSDWVSGWGMTGKGRMWRLVPDMAIPGAAEEISALLSTGMGERGVPELEALCAHAHREVRQEAQLELVERALPASGPASLALMRLASDRNGSRFARLAGVWGLGILARRAEWEAGPQLLHLLDDPDQEIRAQALRVLSDAPLPQALGSVLTALTADAPRVRAFAADALGAMGDAMHVPALVGLLGRDAAADPWIRTAAVHAIERVGSTQQVLGLAKAAEDPEVRRCLAVVLRRWKAPAIAALLADPDPAVVAEVARAIHDEPIPEAREALAELLTTEVPEDLYLVRRSLAAARELHRPADRSRFLDLLTGGELPEVSQVEVLGWLSEWATPNPVDPIHGAWRPVPSGDLAGFAAELTPLASSTAPAAWGAKAQAAWIGLLESLADERTASLQASLLGLAQDPSQGGGLRASALGAWLTGTTDASRAEVLREALQDSESLVRAVALEQLAQEDPERATAALGEVIRRGPVPARQEAVLALGRIDQPAARALLAELAAQLEAEAEASPFGVELLEALGSRDAAGSLGPESELGAEALAKRRLQLPKLVLEGGDPGAGRRIFLEKAEAQCLKCHVVGDQGSSQVGPALTDVAARLSKTELLSSILDPNQALAEGYENWILGLDDGTTLVGRILQETDEEVVVLNAEGEEYAVSPGEIEARRQDVSAMPEDLEQALTLRELRDLVAFLAAQEG